MQASSTLRRSRLLRLEKSFPTRISRALLPLWNLFPSSNTSVLCWRTRSATSALSNFILFRRFHRLWRIFFSLVPVSRGLHGIKICNRTGDFTWFTLKSMFVKLSIAPNTKQERYYCVKLSSFSFIELVLSQGHYQPRYRTLHHTVHPQPC